MAMECLEIMQKDKINIQLEKIDRKAIENIITWKYNGASCMMGYII